MYFVGIDIGTSSISGVAYSEEGEKIESVTIPNNAVFKSAYDWEKTQDPARILDIVTSIISDFSSKCKVIQGIGITGQMHGILYVDHNGQAISPLYTWQDRRANRRFESGMTYAEHLSGMTGYPVASGYGLATHFYNQQNGLVPVGVHKICTIMDYAVMRLVGRTVPLTDYSNGAGLGLFDVQHRCFDQVALQQAGLDGTILPELAESTDVCGYYQGIPVYMAIGDNQAAFWGSVRNLHQSIHITVGTGSQLSVYSHNYLKIPGIDTRPFPGGGYMLVGAALSGGQAFAMLKDFFEETVAKFSNVPAGGQDFYRIMTTIPYDGDIIDLPIVETLFDGTRSSPGKRGKIENISSSNFTPDNLIIGFLKGICRELRQFYQDFPEEIRQGKSVLVGSGNALKMNPLLCRVVEEAFQTRLSFPPVDEEAAFGACLNAISGFKSQQMSRN